MGNTNLFHKARLAVFRFSGIQLAVTVTLALLAFLLSGPYAAASLISGGLIGIIAGLYQAQRMIKVDASVHPEAFMRGLWVSEVVKIMLTVALFIVAIRLLRVAMVPTLVGYAGTYVVYWAMLGTAFPWFESPVSNNDRDRNWPD